MKKLTLLLVITAASVSGFSQIGNPLKKAGEILNSAKNGESTSLSAEEIAAGLKEALSVGASNSTNRLSAADGFLKDAAVKILMPEEFRKIESKMRAVGMGKLFDNAVTSMNRAAEEAAKKAAPIFLNAIKSMSIKDAVGILRGDELAATTYLKNTTSADLTASFKPVIAESLEKVEATKYWTELFTVYNKFSKEQVNTDLTDYVTQKSLEGIFYYVGLEEKKIRKDPAARVSDILEKVFK
ncbi:MAG TPA: DUF4197 domain-containing protein [Parasegetibacter sp.]